MQTLYLKKFLRFGLLTAVVLTLAGCGGGGGGVTTSSTSTSSASTSSVSSGGTNSLPPVPPPPEEPPPSATGSFSLSWTAPVTRADGTPISLAEIEGYRVYYGTSRGNYPNLLNVTSGAATSTTVNNLQPGTYYVVMTTYDNSGLESAWSAAVTKEAT